MCFLHLPPTACRTASDCLQLVSLCSAEQSQRPAFQDEEHPFDLCGHLLQQQLLLTDAAFRANLCFLLEYGVGNQTLSSLWAHAHESVSRKCLLKRRVEVRNGGNAVSPKMIRVSGHNLAQASWPCFPRCLNWGKHLLNPSLSTQEMLFFFF